MSRDLTLDGLENWVYGRRSTAVAEILAALLSPFLRAQLYLTGGFDNAIECEKIIASLMIAGPEGQTWGFHADWQMAELLNHGLGLSSLLLFGNEEEQDAFVLGYSPNNLVRMPTSTNTPEQAEKIVQYCTNNDISCIGILTHEALVPRACMTLIKEFTKRGSAIPIVPFSYIGIDRTEMSQRVRRCGLANEARKLLKYQRKGDVATAEEALNYIGSLQGQVIQLPDIICIIY